MGLKATGTVVSIDRTHRSPNSGSRDGRAIQMIVLHATVGTARSALAWLTNPAARVSAHYLIDKSGRIYQLVADEDAAWHAGRAEWKGETAINELSIGIELENANDGRDPYPIEQITALLSLVQEKVARYQIAPEMITRHLDVALPRNRKTDPAGFPWTDFLCQLFPNLNPPDERPPRPQPPASQNSALAEGLLAESYRQVGAAGQQFWGLAAVAQAADLGMPIGPAFELTVSNRRYSAQSFGRDTLIAALGEWKKAERLSQMTGSTQQPLRDALLTEVYRQAGETYRTDWAMHRAALELPIGPPLDQGQRLIAGGREYVAASYALDVLYSPVSQWSTIGRLTRLPEGGQQEPLRAALYQHWYTRVGSMARPEWVLQQEARRSGLGAPLGPSFRVRYDGHDYAAEAFALDTLACEIGIWQTIIRLRDLRTPKEV
jgi:N-acetyl-anhydromuramyl-L-alanine amidase AmpD